MLPWPDQQLLYLLESFLTFLSECTLFVLDGDGNWKAHAKGEKVARNLENGNFYEGFYFNKVTLALHVLYVQYKSENILYSNNS